MPNLHSFHIPVLGIGFSIDTPLKVAHRGIDSVISLCDDILLEKLRKKYSERYNLSYTEISDDEEDSRARRITAYLNLVNDLVADNIRKVKETVCESRDKIASYFEGLANHSCLMMEYDKIRSKSSLDGMKTWLDENVLKGSIDVNIMTKVDKTNLYVFNSICTF